MPLTNLKSSNIFLTGHSELASVLNKVSLPFLQLSTEKQQMLQERNIVNIVFKWL